METHKLKCACWREFQEIPWCEVKTQQKSEWDRISWIYIWDELPQWTSYSIWYPTDHYPWFYFKDEEDCDLFTNKLNALKAILKWKEENDGWFVPDWEDPIEIKYLISYNVKRGLYANTEYLCKDIPFLPYYSSEEITEQAIKHLSKEYELLLWVEETNN